MKQTEKFKQEAKIQIGQTLLMIEDRIFFDYQDLKDLIEMDMRYLENYWDKLEHEKLNELEKL